MSETENTTGSGRDEKGRFVAGVPGNPHGRPKAEHRVRDLARTHDEEAINTLVSIMRDKEAPVMARIAASNSLLDRGYGRPFQPIRGDGSPLVNINLGGQPIVDATQAAAVYAELCRNLDADFSQLRFGVSAPSDRKPAIEHQPGTT